MLCEAARVASGVSAEFFRPDSWCHLFVGGDRLRIAESAWTGRARWPHTSNLRLPTKSSFFTNSHDRRVGHASSGLCRSVLIVLRREYDLERNGASRARRSNVPTQHTTSTTPRGGHQVKQHGARWRTSSSAAQEEARVCRSSIRLRRKCSSARAADGWAAHGRASRTAGGTTHRDAYGPADGSYCCAAAGPGSAIWSDEPRRAATATRTAADPGADSSASGDAEPVVSL